MRLESKRLKLFRCWFDAGGILATVEMSGDREAGLSLCGANKFQDLLVAVEWLAGPVFGDLGKEAVLNGIPFGSAGRIVSNSESEPQRVGQLRLEFGFPGAAPSTIAATGVAQNEELAGTWIADRALLTPPARNGASGESRSVMGDPDCHRSSIGKQIVDAVGDGDAGGVGTKVVIVDQPGRQIPTRTGIFKVSDEFAFLGVDTNNGQATALEALSKIPEVEELIVAIGAEVSGEFFVIDPQGIAHLMEEASDGVGADNHTEVGQSHGNLIGRPSGPLQTGDGIASRIVFEQELDQSDDVGGFFSIRFRPPPERRVPPVVTF